MKKMKWRDEREKNPCIFSNARPGEPAQKVAGCDECAWCRPDVLSARLASRTGKIGIMRALKSFAKFDVENGIDAAPGMKPKEGVFAAALGRLPSDVSCSIDFHSLATQPRRKLQRQQSHVEKATWEELLKLPRDMGAEPPMVERKAFRAKIMEDQRHVKTTIYGKKNVPRKARASGEDLLKPPDPEDRGLPPASYSDRSKGLESWCQKGAWGMCRECQVLQPRPMRERDLYRDPQPDVPKSLCHHCKSTRKHFVPVPSKVPVELQGLSKEAVLALRPMDVEVGEEQRSKTGRDIDNGYRQKT